MCTFKIDLLLQLLYSTYYVSCYDSKMCQVKVNSLIDWKTQCKYIYYFTVITFLNVNKNLDKTCGTYSIQSHFKEKEAFSKCKHDTKLTQQSGQILQLSEQTC